MHSCFQKLPGCNLSDKNGLGFFFFVLSDKCLWVCDMCAVTQQETIDPRRQMVMGNQVIDARGRKFTKRVVDIRELNEQAKVIDDLK